MRRFGRSEPLSADEEARTPGREARAPAASDAYRTVNAFTTGALPIISGLSCAWLRTPNS